MRLRLESTLDVVQGGSPAAVRELERLHELVGQATADIRRLVQDLRPPALDQLGLIPALEQHVERFGRETGLTMGFSADPALTIPAAAEVAIFRVVQEALVNVQKHARATGVDVHLGREGNGITLVVRDDGVGLADRGEDIQMGTGLRSMRERADLLGGSLQTVSRPNVGTRVIFHLPLIAETSEPA
jgi:signal transduction histidine kinase